MLPQLSNILPHFLRSGGKCWNRNLKKRFPYRAKDSWQPKARPEFSAWRSALAHVWVNSRALGEGRGQLKLWEGKPDLPKMPAGITFPIYLKGRESRRQTYVLLYPGWSKSWHTAAVMRIKMSIWENFSCKIQNINVVLQFLLPLSP